MIDDFDDFIPKSTKNKEKMTSSKALSASLFKKKKSSKNSLKERPPFLVSTQSARIKALIKVPIRH